MIPLPETAQRAADSPKFFSAQVAQARRFYLNLTPPKRISLAVVCGGCERCAPDYQVSRSGFPFYSIEFVARGCGNLSLNGHRFVLKPGSCFAYGPGIAQKIETDVEQPLVKYFVDFAGTKARTLIRGCGLGPGQALRVFGVGEVATVFEEIIRNGLRGSFHSAAICGKLLEYLALKIVESQTAPVGRLSQSVDTYYRCREFIQENFLRLHSLNQVAEECRVNPAHLCRLFRHFEHQSPYQYLLRLKMNHAAELLREPHVLVKQVAEQVGFGDAFHFSRAFKSVLGVSPEAFRRLR